MKNVVNLFTSHTIDRGPFCAGGYNHFRLQCGSLILSTQKKFFWLIDATKNDVSVSCSTITSGLLSMRLCNRFFAFVLIAVTFIVLEFLKFDQTVGAVLILNHCSVSFLLNEFNFLVDVENVSQGHWSSPNISVNSSSVVSGRAEVRREQRATGHAHAFMV